MKKFLFHLSDEEYQRFRTHPATRLYVHYRYIGGDIEIKTNKGYQLAANLEQVIDFGATSAIEVLGLPPKGY